MTTISSLQSTQKRFFVDALACEKRKLDAQRLINYFTKNNFIHVSRISDADIIVFITCAFIDKYEQWCLDKITKLYRTKRADAILIVGGCLPSINPKSLEQFPGIILTHTREIDSFDKILHSIYPVTEKDLSFPILTIPDPNITEFDRKNLNKQKSEKFYSDARERYEQAKQGYKIRIDWGCRGNCSFCVTRLATGQLQSKPMDIILQEFENGLAQGHTDFLLSGGDSGAYGQDESHTIVDLLSIILNNPSSFTIHFHDFGVLWLCKYLDELLPLFKSHSDKLGCFNFPIQSGSNNILAVMRRPTKIESILQAFLRIKTEAPNLMLGTHIIVGFPGESEADFQNTIHFIQQAPIDFINVFRYTDHKLADSRKFEGKVSSRIIEQREKLLADIWQSKMQ